MRTILVGVVTAGVVAAGVMGGVLLAVLASTFVVAAREALRRRWR